MSLYIAFTTEQKERARQTDLVELLRSQGEIVKRSGSEYQWLGGGQKVTIRGNLWFHQYEQKGGDAVDFVRRFYGKSYTEAMEYLFGNSDSILRACAFGRRKLKRLTRNSIEQIANRVFCAYTALPEIRGAEVYWIEPEIVLEKVLNLTLEYAHLSLDGTILGLTSFGEVEVQVFDETDMETYLCLDGKTIAVERDLLADVTQCGRRNFTIAHECSHQIFKMPFPTAYGMGTSASALHFYTANAERRKQISNWEEWQANTLASAILLPEELIKKGMYLFGLGDRIVCLNKIYNRGVYDRFSTLADFLGVSRKALVIRMRQLNLLEKEYLDGPFAALEVEWEALA